jgi:hypothetical protein
MAALAGKSGKVEYKGVPVLRINSWDATVDVDLRDHTSFSTSTGAQWREVKPGLSGGSGTFAGFWDAQGSTAQADAVSAVLTGATGSVKLYADKDGGDHLAGNVYFSGLTAGAQVDGDVTVSFPFTFTGAVSYTTTT